MAIREKEEKKVGMKVTDNMDGEKIADEKLNMQTADLSSKMNTKQINAYIKAYKSGAPVKDILPKGLTKKDLLRVKELEKNSWNRINDF